MDRGEEVLVTGIGVETCIGRDPASLWSSLAEGRSGIRPITFFDHEELGFHVAGEVDFAPDEVMNRTEIRRTERPTQMLLSSVVKALDDAGRPSVNRAGIIVGTGGAGTPTLAQLIESGGLRATSSDPFVLMKTLPNMPAAHVAQRLGITGPVQTVSTACASSTDALGIALVLLRRGVADLVIASGVETWINRPILEAFAKIKALSPRPAKDASIASRPFDRDRDGMVPAEAAVSLVLQRRGAIACEPDQVYGSLLGAASSCDASHPVQPRADGTVAATMLRAAIADAGLEPTDIGLVSAHGTSTPLNDVVETRALRLAFGDHADRLSVTAPKSVTGHASGACGTLEAAGVLLALRHRFVPPTINLVASDPECDLDYTPVTGIPHDATFALSCNFGFGGQNAAVVLGRVDD